MSAINPFGSEGDGATLLSDEDREGLLLTYLTTRE